MEQLFTVHERFQYALRGDSGLWIAMKEYFQQTSPSRDPATFKNQLDAAFLALTGLPVTHTVDVNLEKFNFGGKSAGTVSMKFWQEKGLPLLLTRLTHPRALEPAESAKQLWQKKKEDYQANSGTMAKNPSAQPPAGKKKEECVIS